MTDSTNSEFSPNGESPNEIRIEIKSFIVKRLCDYCKDGFMSPSGEVFDSSYGMSYMHVCEKCSWMASFPKTYPVVEYKEVKDDLS